MSAQEINPTATYSTQMAKAGFEQHCSRKNGTSAVRASTVTFGYEDGLDR